MFIRVRYWFQSWARWKKSIHVSLILSYNPRLGLPCTLQSICPSWRSCLMFRSILIFYREDLLAPRPIPKLEDHPFSSVGHIICEYRPWPNWQRTVHYSLIFTATRYLALASFLWNAKRLVHRASMASRLCWESSFIIMWAGTVFLRTFFTRLPSTKDVCRMIISASYAKFLRISLHKKGGIVTVYCYLVEKWLLMSSIKKKVS